MRYRKTVVVLGLVLFAAALVLTGGGTGGGEVEEREAIVAYNFNNLICCEKEQIKNDERFLIQPSYLPLYLQGLNSVKKSTP